MNLLIISTSLIISGFVFAQSPGAVGTPAAPGSGTNTATLPNGTSSQPLIDSSGRPNQTGTTNGTSAPKYNAPADNVNYPWNINGNNNNQQNNNNPSK